MTQEEITKQKEKLEKLKSGLEAEIKKNETPTEMGDDVDGYEEEADEAEEFVNTLGIGQVSRERLNDVSHALDKIEAGTYGKCESCGAEISMDLLEIDPESRECKNCKLAQK